MKLLEQRKEQHYMGDGYDSMDTLGKVGWHAISSWGVDGWDLGEWPYIIVFHRVKQDGTHEVGYYCEGDLDIFVFGNGQDAIEKIDDLAMWHWKFRDEEWVATRAPEDLRGPYGQREFPKYERSRVA